MQLLAQQKRATFHEKAYGEDEVEDWQRQKKGRDSVSE